MKFLLFLFAALAYAQQNPPRPSISVGPDAPDPGVCDRGRAGNIYIRSQNPANGVNQTLVCQQTGANIYGWTATPAGAALTAAALAATPTLCSAGSYPLGILPNGNATACTVLPSSGPSKIDYQIATSVITGNATIYSTAIPSIPAGQCIRASYNVLSTNKVSSPLYDLCFGGTCITGFRNQPTTNSYVSGELEVCNNPGVQNAQHVNLFCGTESVGNTITPYCMAGVVLTTAADTTAPVTLLFKTISGGGADTAQGIWWHVWGPQ